VHFLLKPSTLLTRVKFPIFIYLLFLFSPNIFNIF
jgi:hypothetical protein